MRASNWSVSGTGTCVANAVLIQTRAYWYVNATADTNLSMSGSSLLTRSLACYSSSPRVFREVTLLEPGRFWIGVTRKSKESLEKHLGERPNSWGMCGGPAEYKAGDIISVSYDLSGIRAELLFALNGVPTNLRVSDVKGDVYPAVSVSDGAVLQANFGATPYKYPAGEGFSAIILSKDLI